MIILRYVETLYMNTRSSTDDAKATQNQWMNLLQTCML